ncbi:MAG: SpoIID/LytB domain-containing protein [Spirulinaceae cyanobacterium RM2_2_10]|nr:SpoIID/LytB domain-containing protein [Spirulinaceae cyanobacterium RM2_2_10]
MRSPLFLPLTASLLSPLAAPPARAAVEIDVGIVQRFGDRTGERLTLASLSGDSLTLEFLGGDGQPQTVTASSVQIDSIAQPQGEPILQEWVVLSDHATFETAEASALAWQAKGIETEVTQPERWQVWAKRDVYNTPVLRRLLLDNLTEQGETGPRLQSQVLRALPRLSFVVAGYRYNRESLRITSRNRRIRVQDSEGTRLYGGDLRVQGNAYGDFTLINEVPIETYLRGVVPHEIGPSAPYNAVEAQTVIARTYALRNLRRFQADGYELCATVHCQVYKGLSGTVERADTAIRATRGLVLTYNNELVDALYSSSSGGITSAFTDTWDGEERPYLQPRVDAIANLWNLDQQPLNNETAIRRFLAQQQGFNGTQSALFRWQKTESLSESTAHFKRYLTRRQHPLANFTRIVRMEVTARSRSGRVLVLAVETDRGVVELEKNEARSAFGTPRSTLFYIDPVLNANQQLTGYRFVGGGFGHGAGLSQFGAYTLAQQGWRYDRILNFYYPGTQIQPLNESIVYYQAEP